MAQSLPWKWIYFPSAFQTIPQAAKYSCSTRERSRKLSAYNESKWQDIKSYLHWCFHQFDILTAMYLLKMVTFVTLSLISMSGWNCTWVSHTLVMIFTENQWNWSWVKHLEEHNCELDHSLPLFEFSRAAPPVVAHKMLLGLQDCEMWDSSSHLYALAGKRVQ